MTNEQMKLSAKNNKLRRKELGILNNYDLVLHHKDKTLRHSDIERYIQWLPEDLEIMTRAEHNTIHFKGVTHEGYNKGMNWEWSTPKEERDSSNNWAKTEEGRKFHSERMKGVNHSGENNPRYGHHEKIGPQLNRTKNHWKLVDGKRIYY